jgi:hypothetical protein
MITESEVLEALPTSGFLRHYVTFCAERTAAHLGFHVGAGLALLAQAAPPDLVLPFSSPLAGHLFVMLVGSSSKAFKTSAINQSLRLLRDTVPDQLYEQPGSREALIDMVRARPHGLVTYTEFGDFLSTAYGDRSYARAMKTAFTAIYDGSPLGRALVKKSGDAASPAPKTIGDPRMSILAGVATPFLEDYTEGADWTGGFLGRFFTIYADPERKFRGEPLDDAAGRRQLVLHFRHVHHLLDGKVPALGRCLWLADEEAQKIWNDFSDEMERRRASAGVLVDAACSRAVAMAAKISLLLSWDLGAARDGIDWSVSADVVHSAVKLATLHLDSVLALSARIVTGRDMQDRRKVLDACPRGALTSLGDVLKRASMLKRRAAEILDSLVEEKTLFRVRFAGQGEFFGWKEERDLVRPAPEPPLQSDDLRLPEGDEAPLPLLEDLDESVIAFPGAGEG